MTASPSQHPWFDAPTLAQKLAATLKTCEHVVRSRSTTVLQDEDRQLIGEAFTEFLTGLAQMDAAGALDARAQNEVRWIAGECLFCSRFWSDAYYLPPGNAKVIDRLYDLENAPAPIRPSRSSPTSATI